MDNTAYIHFQWTILVIENTFQLVIFLQSKQRCNLYLIANQYLCTKYFDISIDMQWYDMHAIDMQLVSQISQWMSYLEQ